MPKSRVKIQPVEEIEWDVVQICAKRVRPNGDVEVLVQYALKWQKVDACIAEGPLYRKFLEDEAVEAGESDVRVGGDGPNGELGEAGKDEVGGGGPEVEESKIEEKDKRSFVEAVKNVEEVKRSLVEAVKNVEEVKNGGFVGGTVQQTTRPVRVRVCRK
jgi:hypothetical protein